jgi:ribosomal protein L32
VSETIHRLKTKTGNFTIMVNEVFQRSDLSAKAKGIYGYIMTLPDDWVIRKQELYTHFAEGKAALDTGFAELECAGYINKRLLRDGHGHITATEYTVYESAEMNDLPKSDNRKTVPQEANSPLSDLPISVYPLSDNRTLLNTNNTKYLGEPNPKNNIYKKIGGGSSSKGSVSEEKLTTTTTIIHNFLRECKSLGFTITEKRARSLLKSGLNPEWLSGPEGFSSFIAAYVNETYQEKPDAERLRLFLSAMTWEDKQAEYGDWLEKRQVQAEQKQQHEETAAEQQRREALRLATPEPTTCLNCGSALPKNSRLCPACDHYTAWDEDAGAYTVQERFDFSSIITTFQQKHRISNDRADEADMDKYFTEAE